MVDGHIPPANPRLPYKVRCRDETGFIHLVFFNARADYLLKALAGRRDARRQRPGRALRAARPSCRWRIRTTSCRWRSWRPSRRSSRSIADRRIDAEGAGQGDPRGARPRAGAAGVAGRGLSEAAGLAGLAPGPAARCISRRASATSRWIRRRASGWPSTSCWPTSWRSPSCAPASAGRRAGAIVGSGRLQARRSPPCPSPSRPRRRARWRRSRPTWRRRRACCACCRATSAAARRWWRCWPC